MAKFTEEEFKARVQYDAVQDEKIGKIYLPNNTFDLLKNAEELTNTNGQRTTTHVDVAFAYLYLTTWLYRNAKYGVMEQEHCTVGAIKELIGFTAKTKGIDYIIKKNGVLDKLGLTKTIPFKEAPITSNFLDGAVSFTTMEDAGLKVNSNRWTIKYPTFGMERFGEDEYGYGTFNGQLDPQNIANTHHVEFEVFIKCMTNDDLGTDAFYLYSYLTYMCNITGRGNIEIGLETISKRTGITRGKRDSALHGLKAHGLIDCVPAPYIVGGNKGEGAGVYSVCGAKSFTEEAKEYQVRTVIPFKLTMEIEVEYKKKEVIENGNDIKRSN